MLASLFKVKTQFTYHRARQEEIPWEGEEAGEEEDEGHEPAPALAPTRRRQPWRGRAS